MEYKMICTDVDGTLLNENHIVTVRTKQSICYAIAQGNVFTITSARSTAGIEPIVKSRMDPRVQREERIVEVAAEEGAGNEEVVRLQRNSNEAGDRIW